MAMCVLLRSHPSRGAWIEIYSLIFEPILKPSRTPHGVRGLKLQDLSSPTLFDMSHPSRGAWIEIVARHIAIEEGDGRTPHGVRGLKLLPMNQYFLPVQVAPLTGCVD